MGEKPSWRQERSSVVDSDYGHFVSLHLREFMFRVTALGFFLCFGGVLFCF